VKLSKLPILLVLCTSIFILETSKSEEVFYKNENTDIEFRIVAETEDGFPWIYLPDQKGSPQKVSQEVIISTKDVEGTTIELVDKNPRNYYSPQGKKKWLC